MNKLPGQILIIILILFIVAVASVLITDGASILAKLGSHIMGLFQRGPRFYPQPNKEFVQLILIAVFVGWAINRFKKRR